MGLRCQIVGDLDWGCSAIHQNNPQDQLQWRTQMEDLELGDGQDHQETNFGNHHGGWWSLQKLQRNGRWWVLVKIWGIFEVEFEGLLWGLGSFQDHQCQGMLQCSPWDHQDLQLLHWQMDGWQTWKNFLQSE